MALSLPGAHCAACISTVERALAAHPLVRDARVNLTLKRVTIDAEKSVAAQDMIDVLAGVGFEAHELDASVLQGSGGDPAGRDLLMRVAVAGFAMMNVLLLSVAVWAGAEGATRDMLHWVSAVIALPAIVFAARPFFANAYSALRVGRLNMDVPISLALVLATGLSLYETSQHGENAYFDAALSLTFFLLVGRYLDHRTRSIARSAAQELAALETPRAILLDAENAETTVAVAELHRDDLILVRPGGRIPADGVVIRGESEVDRGLLTGESLPVFAGAQSVVSAGELNLTGPLTVRVTAAGRDSTLHRMTDLVAVAESGRNSYTSLADRAAAIYAPGVHVLSALAFVGWFWVSGDLRLAVDIAVAVLIITCPCALGLAVPAVSTAASGKLFRRGLLIKDATALERLAQVDIVAFDKTGTLTLGAPAAEALESHPRADVAVAMALAAGSSHPLAGALVEAARRASIAPAPVSGLREVPGYGVEGRLRGETVRLGRAEWVGAEPAALTATYLRLGHAPARTFTFADTLRPGAAAAVAGLRAQGMRVLLLSGDTEPAVRAIAQRLAISEVVANARPEEKARKLADLAAEGHRVLMVGDGLNDTVALRTAHVSISPASALDAARVASDIVCLGQDLSPLAEALATGRSARRRIRENFTIAALYNAVAIPVALIGLATPLAAALAMSASSITVSLNSLRVR